MVDIYPWNQYNTTILHSYNFYVTYYFYLHMLGQLNMTGYICSILHSGCGPQQAKFTLHDTYYQTRVFSSVRRTF